MESTLFAKQKKTYYLRNIKLNQIILWRFIGINLNRIILLCYQNLWRW